MHTLFTSLTLLVPTVSIPVVAFVDSDARCDGSLSCSNDSTTGKGSPGFARLELALADR